MQVALIVPRKMIKWARLGDLHFIIPPTADVSFYRAETKYKILDNGAYELVNAIPMDKLIYLGKRLKVDEIIVPDKLLDFDTTLRRAEKFYNNYSVPFKTMIVPQAENPALWIDTYKLFVKTFTEADAIGIPKWLDSKYHCRSAVINYLARKGELARKPHHFLGVDSLAELLTISQTVKIRSCDTSKPFTYAYANKALSFWSMDDLPRVRFNTYEHCNEVLLLRNINILKEAAHWNDST